MACPDWVRRAHAVAASSFAWCSFGTVRTPRVPSAWHDWQEFFSVSIQ